MDTTPTREEMDAKIALIDGKLERYQIQTNARLDRIEGMITALTEQFRAFRGELSAIRAKLEQVDVEFGRVHIEIERVRAEIYKAKIDMLKWCTATVLTVVFGGGALLVRLLGG